MAGILAGALAGRKTGGTDASNYFSIDDQTKGLADQSLKDVLNFKNSAAATDPLESSRIATQEVQNNPILGQLFNKGGAMDRANSEEQRLSTQGYQLTPEDREAYGQASGDISRQFGMQQNNLAQALASRGLSNSGVAGRSFATSQGNKMEQLAGLQTQIANARMNNTMQRLNQTRQYLTQLGGQGENAIQGQFGRQQAAEGQGLNQLESKYNTGESRLRDVQNQSNEQLSQRMATQEMPGWAHALSNMSNMGSQIGTTWATMGMNQGKSGEDAQQTNTKKGGDQFEGMDSEKDFKMPAFGGGK